jgi:hypothetical protein
MVYKVITLCRDSSEHLQLLFLTSIHPVFSDNFNMAFLAFLLVICLMSGIVRGQETNNNESEKAFEEEFGIK